MCLFDALVNKGELTVRLNQVTELAPIAQVIIYCVMANGEMVADSKDFPVQLCLNNKVGSTKIWVFKRRSTCGDTGLPSCHSLLGCLIRCP